MHIAIYAEATQSFDVLLKYGFDLDEKDNKGNTPLHLSSRYNYESGARILLQHGASSLTRNNEGENA